MLSPKIARPAAVQTLLGLAKRHGGRWGRTGRYGNHHRYRAHTLQPISPFRIRRRQIDRGVATSGHKHQAHRQRGKPDSDAQQRTRRGRLDAPHQRRGACLRHPTADQPIHHAPFLAYAAAPVGSQAHGPNALLLMRVVVYMIVSGHIRNAYSPLPQSGLLAAANALQSSGGFPRPSIFSNTA